MKLESYEPHYGGEAKYTYVCGDFRFQRIDFIAYWEDHRIKSSFPERHIRKKGAKTSIMVLRFIER